MPFHETAAWSAIHAVAVSLWFLFMVTAFLRTGAAPGTNARYVWATAQWAVIYPALLLPVRDIIHGGASADGWHLILGSVFSIIWVVDYRALRNSGDDNWFRRTGKRLRRWIKSHTPALFPSAAPTSA